MTAVFMYNRYTHSSMKTISLKARKNLDLPFLSKAVDFIYENTLPIAVTGAVVTFVATITGFDIVASIAALVSLIALGKEI